ncbi:hypothetical protein IFM12276_30470 [Nocardia sputorum]|uniref:Carotenoid biosynthesis protein n=1 Tax=Nocardia sputorum TaxID=2984338 RepID=A0ABM8CYB0_9NOCA|nr:hypothetical protein IFM12276_30470 [Nocardia sputorum]
MLATLGGTGHNWFERWAGVGVFLEPWLGRRATNVLWAVAPALLLRSARPRGRADEAVLAFNAGVSIASVVVHFVDWPWSRRLGIFPWLDEAEGMDHNLLPPYNAVLWLWGIGGVGAVLTETRRADLKFVAAGLLTGPLLLASARHHFVWAREQANHTSGEDGQWSSAFIDTPDRTEPGRPGSALDVPPADR